MIFSINQSLAQQIVDTVKSVCGQDINCIDKSGMVLCSTNEKRVGTYHEIGREVAQTGKTIEVFQDDNFTGTRRGVNLPIYYDHNLLAVIGISGDPEDVRKYAFLAQKVTTLLIREREIATDGRNLLERKRYLIQAFLQPEITNREYLDTLVQEFGINISRSKRFLIVHLNDKLSKGDLHIFDYGAQTFFQNAGIDLYAYSYPNKYYAIVEEDIFQGKKGMFQGLNETEPSLLRISVGVPTLFYHLWESYETSRIAWRSMRNTSIAYVQFDDLPLELLLRGIDHRFRKAFVNKTVCALDDSDMLLLKTYFHLDCSLSRTSEALHMHKNTLQYQLKKIRSLCGLDPRSFRDGVLLFLGIQAKAFDDG